MDRYRSIRGRPFPARQNQIVNTVVAYGVLAPRLLALNEAHERMRAECTLARNFAAAEASDRQATKEGAMFGEGHTDSIVQRGIDEALACQDMLARAPVKPSRLPLMVARITATARAIARHEVARVRRMTSAVQAVRIWRWVR
jgi:hypothetical protein